MVIKKIITIIFASTIRLSPFATEAMEQQKKSAPAPEKVASKNKEESALTPLLNIGKTAYNWPRKAWREGGAIEKTCLATIPLLGIFTLYHALPTTIKLGFYSLKAAIVYLAYKGTRSPKTENSWSKEIKKDAAGMWNWFTGFFKAN